MDNAFEHIKKERQSAVIFPEQRENKRSRKFINLQIGMELTNTPKPLRQSAV